MMSVRLESTSSTRETDDRDEQRKKPTEEEGRRFRSLLQEGQSPAPVAEGKDEPTHWASESGDDDSPDGGAVPITSLYQSVDFASNALPAGPTLTQDLRELLTNYADRIVIGRLDARQGGETAVVLGAGVLPDTTMTLVRGQTGWRLVARTTSVDSYRVLTEHADGLKERFHARHLGELEVSAVLSDVDVDH